MAKRYHVVPNKEVGWQVKGENAEKAIKNADTKKEALEIARQIAINQKAELIIHGLNGQIQNSNSYGNDPNPPKDKK